MVQALYLAAPEPARLTPQRRNMTGIDAKLPLVNGSYRPEAAIPKLHKIQQETEDLPRQSQRKRSVLNDPLHDQGRGQSLHIRQSRKALIVKSLEGWQVLGNDVQQVIWLPK